MVMDGLMAYANLLTDSRSPKDAITSKNKSSKASLYCLYLVQCFISQQFSREPEPQD